ncbi:MAG: flagellar biosynthesis protein [Thermoclostridium sp.]|nr:flagellar biosynthesis protein [Thermoclostridium sp.]
MVYNSRPISQVPPVTTGSEVQNKPITQPSGSFANILKDKLDQDVKISKHAQTRMEMRNVNLTEAQRQKLSNAIDKANAKGVRDTLIVMERMAFVVNVKNRTVITAMSSAEMRENVFTNIDGAVFAD